MKKKILMLAFALCSLLGFAQNVNTISGRLIDQETKEHIIGASISAEDGTILSISNEYGYFSFSAERYLSSIHVRHIAYQKEKVLIDMECDTFLLVPLKPAKTQLETVVVSAVDRKPMLLHTTITPKEIRESPAIFGEPDVVKVLQNKKGINTLGDGSSGLFVKGGKTDQNLYLIDEAPIYNTAHMFGLVSVYNPDILKNFKLYDAYIPAQFGGRVSAVLDAYMKEGDKRSYSVRGGVSPMVGRLTVEGPINEASSFIVSARRSIMDLFSEPTDQNSYVPGFFDVYAKANVSLSESNNLYVSFFNTNDRVSSLDNYQNQWRNLTSSARWSRLWSPTIFSNTSLILSQYVNQLKMGANEEQDGPPINWETGIKDIKLLHDMSWFIANNFSVDLGVSAINHQFTPGETAVAEESISTSSAIEYGVYAGAVWRATSRINLEAGMRLSGFASYGDFTWFSYNQFYQPIRENKETGFWSNHLRLEPRFNLDFHLNEKVLLGFSYTRNTQYMQELSNSALAYTNFQMWLPVTPNMKPLEADMISVNAQYTLKRDLKLGILGYYKKINNQFDFVDNARMLGNRFIEGDIRSGKVRAFGLEFLTEGSIHKLSFDFSYTFSRVLNTIKGINKGITYPANHDIPHVLKTNLLYPLNKRLTLSSHWTYTTGRPTNFPIGFYEDNGLNQFTSRIPIYGNRNEQRFPDYHRLDVSLKYQLKSKGAYSHSISLGAYNVYARKNPLEYQYLFYGAVDEVRVVTFYSIIPMVNYEFSLKGWQNSEK